MLKQNSSNWYYKPESFRFYGPDWMRVKDGEFAGAPFRAFVSEKYQKGYSDHFPVFIEIVK